MSRSNEPGTAVAVAAAVVEDAGVVVVAALRSIETNVVVQEYRSALCAVYDDRPANDASIGRLIDR